jgi:hypothetical protein
VSGGLHREATQSSPAPAEASWTIARLVPSWIGYASESAPRPMTMHHDLPRFAAIVERASLVLNATEPCVLRLALKDTGVLQTDAIEAWAFCKPSRIVFTARHMMATRAAIFLHLARSLRSATRPQVPLRWHAQQPQHAPWRMQTDRTSRLESRALGPERCSERQRHPAFRPTPERRR